MPYAPTSIAETSAVPRREGSQARPRRAWQNASLASLATRAGLFQSLTTEGYALFAHARGSHERDASPPRPEALLRLKRVVRGPALSRPDMVSAQARHPAPEDLKSASRIESPL